MLLSITKAERKGSDRTKKKEIKKGNRHSLVFWIAKGDKRQCGIEGRGSRDVATKESKNQSSLKDNIAIEIMQI